MKNRYRGFGIVELLVIILVLVLVVLFLFTIFSNAHKVPTSIQCTSNQRNIITAIMVYAQEHEERLPARDTVWSDIKLDRRVLRCPNKPDLENGYVYNGSLSNLDGSPNKIGEYTDPTSVLVTTDGYRAAAPVNVAMSPQDIDVKRHMNSTAVASFLDGHSELFIPNATMFGIELVGSNRVYGTFSDEEKASLREPELRMNLSRPLDGKTPLLTLATAEKGTFNLYGAWLQQEKLGTHGYCIFTADEAGKVKLLQPAPAQTAPAGYVIHPPSKGFAANTSEGLGTIIDTAGKDATPLRVSGIIAHGLATINISVPDDTTSHYLTVLAPPTKQGRNLTVGLVPTRYLGKIGPAFFPRVMNGKKDNGHIYQFRFSGDVTLVVNAAPATVQGTVAGNVLQGIFLD